MVIPHWHRQACPLSKTNGVILTMALLMKFPWLAVTCWRNFTRLRRLPTVPFGGINVIFLGDFVQYAPVLDRPLYSNLPLPNDTLSNTIAEKPNGRRTVSERDIQCKVGRALWLQVNKVVFLTQQMRNKDHDFMDMQTRLRVGECNDVS